MEITDEAFARAFEQGLIPPSAFGHMSHLRVAWVYLEEAESVEQALARMRDAIRAFAAAAGVPGKYHETITILWMRLLADVRARGASGELAEVLRAHPALGDKDLPLQYYTRERLFSEEARSGWIEPDRRRIDD